MSWSRAFISQDYGRPVYKYKDLPVYVTDEFDFFRCIEFKDDFYGKTASELFNGNLRFCSGRYTSLFPGMKISYWADSVQTARAEIKKHGAGNNILTFWAYDDGTSTFPTLPDQEPLIIIDGRKCGAQELIDKADAQIPLSDSEQKQMIELLSVNPDCMAFDSHAIDGGENFIFFEKGFKKLALRQIRLRFGRKDGGHHNRIVCADFCDYTPFVESYGEYFLPKAKIAMSADYCQSEEYKMRKQICEESHQKMWEAMHEQT